MCDVSCYIYHAMNVKKQNKFNLDNFMRVVVLIHFEVLNYIVYFEKVELHFINPSAIG